MEKFNFNFFFLSDFNKRCFSLCKYWAAKQKLAKICFFLLFLSGRLDCNWIYCQVFWRKRDLEITNNRTIRGLGTKKMGSVSLLLGNTQIDFWNNIGGPTQILGLFHGAFSKVDFPILYHLLRFHLALTFSPAVQWKNLVLPTFKVGLVNYQENLLVKT